MKRETVYMCVKGHDNTDCHTEIFILKKSKNNQFYESICKI